MPHEATAERLTLLRTRMKKARLAGYIVPRQDEFQGEYVAACAERLKWLTGFAGSWGTSIITLKDAAIFVDGRYTVQVREQVDVSLITPQHLVEHPLSLWITENFSKGDRIGFDPWLMSMREHDTLAKACEKIEAKLVAVAGNLIDEIWQDRPATPDAKIKLHPLKYAGQSVSDKFEIVTRELQKQSADAVFIADPASVSWLFNIRGNDLAHVPTVQAYAIVGQHGKGELFIDLAKVPEKVAQALDKNCTIRKPDEIETALEELARKGIVVMLDPVSVPEAVNAKLHKSGSKVRQATDPCSLPKAMKNATEQEGARQAHIRDGMAMVNFLHWFETEAAKGELNEAKAAKRLHDFRIATRELLDLSFETIPAAGPNAAIPHYHVDAANPRNIGINEIFLIDSGGQYIDGTTDITRTLIVGKPTDEMRDRFTRVLKGMIQISLLRFPKGTTGAHLDAFARASLWKAGLDFDHGTGHGVGSYLSVHEGPQRFAKQTHVELKPGMIISNEPGYYKPGEFGIRIENLLIVTEPQKIAGGDRDMMGFETITLCPIERDLIDAKMLTKEELDWLDAYHAQVWRELRPHVTGPLATWLTRACAPIR
jgi:Xaa-Pro aminopeptidase